MTYHFKTRYNHHETTDVDYVGRFLTPRSRLAPPTMEECHRLFIAMKKGSDDARNELIERHLRLVASIVLKYKSSEDQVEDLMAEGIHGLIEALDRFDHTRGVKISTYAALWIKHRIQKLLGRFNSCISVPHDVIQGRKKQNKLLEDFVGTKKGEPSEEELREFIGDHSLMNRRISMIPKVNSLDETINESEQTLGSLLASEDEEKKSYRNQGSLTEDMQAAMSLLGPREKKVLKLRFGLGTASPMKLGAIAKLMKISAERVHQLESLGLRKLRSVMISKGEIDFRKLDRIKGSHFRGKTKMSPLQLALL